MRKICCAALFCLTGAMLFPAAAGLAADVCGQGVGIPPFLSSGAKPNLLMVLDNSGSMLDAAYSEDGSFCFDDTYDKDKTYAGYFQNDQWYEWSEGDYAPWESGNTSYKKGDRVYVQGVLWEAMGDVLESGSNGTSPEDDQGVAWKKVFSLPKWKNDTTYAAGSFVWEGPQLYYTAAGGTSNDPDASDGLSLTADIGIKDWKAVDSTWLPKKSYSAGTIVTYRGILYETATGGTSSSTSLYEDPDGMWEALDEGSFVAVSMKTALDDCANAAGATDIYKENSDLCISINNDKIPAQVPAFAARGNLLNWAMSSKFDVEKKILTGGKYNYKDDILVSEHRGCAGSRMVKQLQVAGASTTDDATDDKFLSLGVRASRYSDKPLYEDRIDSTDDTGRLEVLAVTDRAYELSKDCEDAITKIVEHGLNGAQNDIKQCIATFPDASSDSVAANTRPTLNNSLQLCWQKELGGQWQNVIDDCVTLYTGEKTGTANFTPTRAFYPAELRPADGGPYLCYGVYDSETDPNNRAGYMGRCWIQGGGGLVQRICNQLTTDQAGSTSLGASECWDYNNKDVPTAESPCQHYRNNNGFVEQCTVDDKELKKDPCPSGSWQKLGRWDDGSGIDCDYPQVQQYCPSGTNCNGTWEDPTWPDDSSSSGNCIMAAINDYCDALKVPEVIDPSDTAGKTGDTGNMPGLIRDSYLMAYLGGEDPIATMKGHIYQAKRPEGVVHRVAGDLRLGMMSFRYVGAKTECDLAATTTDSKIEKYCPLNNMDGAVLRTPLDVGDYVVDNDDPSYESGKRRHVDDLAEAINTTRGTSWTPLAEAMYEAVGYYTQNINFCLNKDGSGECIDFPTADNPNDDYFPTVTKSDPIQYWCQDNHILLITEGESTADVNEHVKDISGVISASDPHILSASCPGLCTAHGKDSCVPNVLTGDGDDADDDGVDDTDCTGDGLYTSSYLDNMTWLGQNVQPLYKNRCVDDAAKETQTEKQAIYTHVVTTGTLLNEGTGECNPETLMTQAAVNGGTNDYYPGENPQQLEDNLYAVFDDILSRSSAGSAASVISSSRSGSGAVYQAVFWPKFEDGDPDGKDGSNKVSWVGDVHSLFVSSKGLMYEDTNQDGKLDETVDKRILFYFSDAANKTRGCYDTAAIAATGTCPEPTATKDDIVPDCDPDNGDQCVELQDIKYIWSANKKLADRDVAKDRKLFTWNDFNNNGIVDTDEWFQLNDQVDWTALDTEAAKSGTRGPVSNDFLKEDDVDNFVVYDASKSPREMELDALKTLTLWLQGVDVLPDKDGNITVTDTKGNTWDAKELRSRKFTFKTKTAEGLEGYEDKTWRLGDIIHSTPMVVAKPAESYHLIYRDPTYNDFVNKWTDRRSMIYFGGNDGMLHAVNGGFYANNQFCCTAFDSDGNCPSAPSGGVCGDGHPDLGEELWAYIPYNLQPHLKCLADRFYAHKSYVDLKPRILDVQIFVPENACNTWAEDPDTSTPTAPGCFHPGGWGTILVGGMRFGGTPVAAMDVNDTPNDDRKFISAYFVLDITNPEKPVLLGEMTQNFQRDGAGNLIQDNDGNYMDEYTDMQYTASSPSMIIMRDGGANAATTKWYLTLGSGPANEDGTNNNDEHGKGKLAVIPLNWLEGTVQTWKGGVPQTISSISKKAFRIPNQEPNTDIKYPQGGRFIVPGGASFISDIISIDYSIDSTVDDDLGASSTVDDDLDDLGARYRTDAIYFGTTDGTDFAKYPSGYLNGAAEQFYWNGGGRVFRLVTKVLDSNGNEKASQPSDWAGRWTDNNPLRLLADVKMPVVGAQSVGYDGWNYWVYAGTGRFYSDQDKTDDGWCLDPTETDCEKRSKAAIFGFREPFMDTASGFDDWNGSGPPKAACDDKIMTWKTIDWNINENTNDQLNHNGEVGERGLMQTDNILVEQGTGYLYCYHCETDPADPNQYVCTTASGCFPSDLPTKTITVVNASGQEEKEERYTFDNLKWYIAGEFFNPDSPAGDPSGCITTTSPAGRIQTGLDGWYRAFHDSRERNLGASALLGGLLTFTTYQPYNDKCQAEGQSYLYGVHYQTGTAWTETVFGTFDNSLTDNNGNNKSTTIVKDKMSLGRGLSTTPSMHVGNDESNDAKAFIQTSTGEIIEVEQKNLPIKAGRSGRLNWNDRLGADE